jgi:hypothetical protein
MTMRRLLQFILAFLVVSTVAWADAEPGVDALPANACDYYLQRESQSQCGSRGYFLRFGRHYCTKFQSETWSTLSDAGKRWLNETLICLQDEMKTVPVDTPCFEVWGIAQKHHNTCYIQHGYCGLPALDRLKIIGTARRELLNPINLIGAAIFDISCRLQ